MVPLLYTVFSDRFFFSLRRRKDTFALNSMDSRTRYFSIVFLPFPREKQIRPPTRDEFFQPDGRPRNFFYVRGVFDMSQTIKQAFSDSLPS